MSAMSAMSAMSMSCFESSVFISEQLNRQMVNAAQELAQRSIKACAEHYNFDAEEAIRLLGLVNLKVARTKPIAAKAKKEKVMVAKPAFPLPYNGEFNDACCYALRQNSGLYTQCQAVRKSLGKNGDFCKQCQALADKTEGVPEYGTIQMRKAVGVFEYVDPKGRKPVAYTKVMKKYKLDQEQVLNEAGKFNIIIDANHFVAPETDSKRGRPSSQKDKEPKEKGPKGRPKKTKKVLQIEGDDEDLFAALVADANNDSGEESVVSPKTKGAKKGKSDAEKEALAQEKEAKRLAEKAEREAKIAAEKAAKEAERLALAQQKEAKKKAEEEEKAAKKLAAEQAKAAKDAEKAAAKEASKSAKKSKAPAAAAKEPEKSDEPDVVKKIEFEGKKYLKSKNTGIVYDYVEYTQNGEQVVVGKWNNDTNKIDFNESGEESEEEYDM